MLNAKINYEVSNMHLNACVIMQRLVKYVEQNYS